MKTLLLMTTRALRRFEILTVLLSLLALIPAGAEAKTITLGEIELSGSFTLNPAYNFNEPTAQPFGSFSDLTVMQASKRFTPFVHRGDALVMTTPYLLSPPATALAENKPLAGQLTWSIAGYSIDTTWNVITGADIAGRDVSGLFDLSGHHFDRALDALGAFGYWDFTAPPYDISKFTQPVTGPITLTIHVAFDNGHGDLRSPAAPMAFAGRLVEPEIPVTPMAFVSSLVVPEPSSLLLLACSLIVLACWRWKQQTGILS